jgi:hypothetical protein
VTEPHHEPSYYEIALTNRQVVVAFVVLLVCLLAAFFSGVWIGRGSADRNGGEPQVARLAPPPEATEGRNLEELKFFSDESGAKRRGKGRGEAANGASAPAGSSPSAAPAPQEETETAAPPPPPTRRTPPPAPEADESAAAPAPPSRRSAPAPAAAPARPAERTASAPPPSDDSVAVVHSRRLPDEAGARTADTSTGGAVAQSGTGSTVIQVFASADSNEAKKVRDRLARGGERAFLSPLTVDGRTMYRVRVGPFASRSLAQKEADRVRRAYKLDTWLTE